MEKDFWVALAKNDYKIPDGHTPGSLTTELFSYLGSTDPELRDDIAYIVYANLLKREAYSQDEIQSHVRELIANLDKGIGETESDSVFLRTFSVLFLAEIVHNDNKKPLLDKEQARAILAKALWYIDAEKDARGHIPVKGWAHALAHTADLLLVLAKNRHTGEEEHKTILNAVAKKLVGSTNWVYIHGEDERLAGTILAILERDLISTDFLREWLESLTEPDESWKGTNTEEGRAKAFHNVRNLLRSVSEEIRKADNLQKKDELQASMHETLNNLRPY